MLYAFLILYAISTLWAILSIILYGNRPARSIGWIFVVIVFPILGVILYMLFGINRKKFRFFTLNFNAKRRLYDLNHTSENIEEFKHKFDSDKFGRIAKLLENSSGFPAIDGNSVTLLKNGQDTFDLIFKALHDAKYFIHLQYYILEEGEILDKLCALFQKKVEEGVEVRILYDALGSFGWKDKTIKKLKKTGVHVFPILPIKLSTILSTLNFRNHRKIIVIDGCVAFAGGVNISDKYISDHSPMGIWDDLHIKLEGSVVDHLHRVFIKDYYFASNETLLTNKKYLPKQTKAGDSLLQIVCGGPDLKHLSILHQYVTMVHSAEESIHIENPYFIPNRMLLEALKMAVLRGVKVNIMVPTNSDSKMAKNSMFGNFESLLEVGVNIYTLKDTFSHSKVIVIDKQIASIGSGNFDYRSFEYNYEVNTLIFDEAIAIEMVEDFENNIKNCRVLNYRTFKERPVSDKLLEGMAKIFSPLL
ncbi:cardiolipin synthase [Changchengzhania lutea]|uniref:cardiolipin synthase n=1 Tax=Changchengzhania lutea TaxID=2049305 RepID=UPI00115C90C3|nr:cardiolipin synthase [Changchengzhania lutea]